MADGLVKYDYKIDVARHYGSDLQSRLQSTSSTYLEKSRVTELNVDVMKPLLELQRSIGDIPKVQWGGIWGTIFGNLSRTKIAHKIEESRTKLGSVQTLVDKVRDEANGHLAALNKNIEDTTDFLNNSKTYVDEALQYIENLEKKITEVKADNNPDLKQKNFYLQILAGRETELKSAVIMVKQQMQQVASIRSASYFSEQKLETTINIGLPLLSSQLSQAIMTLKLEHSNDTIDAFTDTLTKINNANTESWSKSMIRTAEQQKSGIIDPRTMESNRKKVIATVQKVIQIQNTDDEEGRRIIQNELEQSLKLEQETTKQLSEGVMNQSDAPKLEVGGNKHIEEL